MRLVSLTKRGVRRSKAYLLPLFKAWQKHHLQVHAGALAFFGALALGPLALVGLRLLTRLYGTAAAVHVIAGPLRLLLGAPALASVREMINNDPTGSSLSAMFFGLTTFLVGLQGASFSLASACDRIWHHRDADRARSVKQNAIGLASFAAFGALFAASLVFTAWLTGRLLDRGGGAGPLAAAAFAVEALGAWGVLSLICAGMLRSLPGARLQRRELLRAGATMALLLTLGKWILAVYLMVDDVSGVYGNAGTLATLFLYLYYAAQALLLGALMARR